MKIRTRGVLIFILFFFEGCSIVFAGESTVDPREAAIDRAIGGMTEGSRPLSSQNNAGKEQARKIPGSKLSPSLDARATASAGAQNSFRPNTTGNAAGGSGGNESGNTGTGGTNLNETTQQVTTGETETGTNTEPATEPPSEGSAGGSIVTVDAGVDLSGESPVVDANLAVDTNADTLLDANTSATTDVISTDAAVTESGTVAGEDIATTVNEAPLDATLDAEVVSTDTPADSEATAGLEATVDPVTADAPATDPADGLTL